MSPTPEANWWRRHWPSLAMASMVALTVTLLLSRWDGPFPEDRVGTIGEWLSAVGAVFAAIVALQIANRSETLDAHREQLRDRREWRDEAARRIVAVRSVVMYDVGFGQNGPPGRYRLTARVVNHSGQAIRSPRVVVEWKVPVVPDKTSFTLRSVLGPGEAEGVQPEIGHDGRIGLHDVISLISVRFIDVHGDEWMAAFGPKGEKSSIRRLNNRSGFWDTGSTEWMPELEP